VEKPAHELNIVEVQTAVSNAELRLLTRGKLVLSIASKKKPTELRLEGKVITRATCEIFQVTDRHPGHYTSFGFVDIILETRPFLKHHFKNI
jgi:hypothetical protein